MTLYFDGNKFKTNQQTLKGNRILYVSYIPIDDNDGNHYDIIYAYC